MGAVAEPIEGFCRLSGKKENDETFGWPPDHWLPCACSL